MIVCVIRIILPGIIFRDNGICCQIKEQSRIPSYDPANHLIQVIVRNDFSDYDKGANMDTSAPHTGIQFKWKQLTRKEFQELFIGKHIGLLFRVLLPYAGSFRYIVLLFLVVRSPLFQIDI